MESTPPSSLSTADPQPEPHWLVACRQKLQGYVRSVPALWLTIGLSCLIGVAAGYGAVLFTWLIHTVSGLSVTPVMKLGQYSPAWFGLLVLVPALGLLGVSWFTRSFAPEAQGHGVPEVVYAVARKDGVIRPRVAIVKILASGFCIGTGGSVGREGPIVQIGSSLGSVAGQLLRLSSRYIKVLVAAGAAAGISATFNAPLAGVIFASEIILGSFAAESLTPIVIASVLADVVQQHAGEHKFNPAFQQLNYEYLGAVGQLPSHFILGLVCGLGAVLFTKMVYATEDLSKKIIPKWWLRALICGSCVGLAGLLYPAMPPQVSPATSHAIEEGETFLPPLFGVGYEVVDHALHLESTEKPIEQEESPEHKNRVVQVKPDNFLPQLLWILPLVFLKPLLTSLTLAGGGSGGIFAPSLFIGATLGAAFGLLCNIVVPGSSANPGVYAIVGMGAVVAGTTHGVLSAILIVYEMTGDYHIILPIMVAAGLASVVARFIDPESIYEKKLSRRGESLARGHDMHHLEHVNVRDVMIRNFPTVTNSDDASVIIRVARANPSMESLPVMDERGRLVGIIRPEDLHRVLDSDIPPQLVQAEDVAIKSPISVSPDENLLEALRDFGTRDVETLPVEVTTGGERMLVGLLLRSDVMRRYRQEMLKR